MGNYTTLSDFGRRTRTGIEESLFTGESFLGAIDVFDALRASRRTKLVLTDRRLLEFKRGIIRQSIKDYDREQISNVSFDKGIIYRKLSVTGSGFNKKWTVDPEGGRQFSAALRDRNKNPVFERQSTSEDGTDTDSADTASGVTNSTETDSVVADPDSSATEPPRLINPDAEVYGYNNWHYGAIATAAVGMLGYATNISGLLGIGLLATASLLYLDTQYIQKASTWEPRTWIYLAGLLVVFLSLPVYLYHRHQVMSRSESTPNTGVVQSGESDP